VTNIRRAGCAFGGYGARIAFRHDNLAKVLGDVNLPGGRNAPCEGREVERATNRDAL
jgi:hypothetical protein